MKDTHFSNRESLRDAMSNLGLKHSDIDMSNKRMPVSMSIGEVIAKPRPFKKGGLAPMPADKLHRLVKPCRKMPCPKTPHFNQGGMPNEAGEQMGVVKDMAEKARKGYGYVGNKFGVPGYNKGGMCGYDHGGMCGMSKKSRKSKKDM